jgi:hypothetical protein
MRFQPGDRVEVNWGRRGWLPGIFESYASSADPGEDFKRIRVAMDNGFGCTGSGYHPDCVRPASVSTDEWLTREAAKIGLSSSPCGEQR